MRVEKTLESQSDLQQIRDYILAENKRAALDFIDAAEETFSLIGRFPEVGHTVPYGKDGLRVLRVVRYKRFFVFYEVLEDHVLVIRIAHGMRDLPLLFEC